MSCSPTTSTWPRAAWPDLCGDHRSAGSTGRRSYDADTLAFGQKLVDECHKYGAKMGYQMSGFGMGENDMTIDDIHAKQAHFVEVAKGLQQMGFDCVELNCAGFNMPAHFLSRFHNTRTDEYGIGSIENRARFITEIIEGVKKECGPDFNMQILINCIEENDNISNNPTMMTLDSAVTTPHTLAMTMEEGIAAAKLFEQAGCDSMHLRLGPWATTLPSSVPTCTSS